MVELGAGTHIPSARYFGNQVVHDYGGRLIRINPREADVRIRLDVGLGVGALVGLRSIDEALAAESRLEKVEIETTKRTELAPPDLTRHQLR